ncbi:MAG: hypothetical protein AAF919_17325 [Pseudomonadota bacterium]
MTEVIDVLDQVYTNQQTGLLHIFHLPVSPTASTVELAEGTETDGDLAAISRAAAALSANCAVLLRTATRHAAVTAPGGLGLVGDKRFNLGMALRSLPARSDSVDWRGATEPTFEVAERRVLWALASRFGRTAAARVFRIEGPEGPSSWYVDADGVRALSDGWSAARLHQHAVAAAQNGNTLSYRVDPMVDRPDGIAFGPAAFLQTSGENDHLRLDPENWPTTIPKDLRFSALCALLRLATAATRWSRGETDLWFQLRRADRQVLVTAKQSPSGLVIETPDTSLFRDGIQT